MKSRALPYALLFFTLHSFAFAQNGAKQPDPFQDPFANPTDNPCLPRVLIVGDSISIGYTPRVRRLLDGVANVHRPRTNCRWSAFGDEHILEWVGDSKWDVIHFNFGLWDWYGWSQDPKATPESYAASLDGIATKLGKTGAKLIFGMTTPPCLGPEKKVKIVISEARAKEFNDAATAVMKNHGILINDLYSVIGNQQAKYQRGEDDVHYTEEGRDLLAAQVAKVIQANLPSKKQASARPAKPNIVLILADDLGWQDVKCYDIDAPCPMETPNLDRLATKGIKFWQAYSPAPTCAPSRCAIMSGIHPARAQKTHVVGGAPPAPHHLLAWSMMSPWYSGRMPEDTFTLARALKSGGYTTGHCGKWHMAISHNAFPQPEDVGFDWTRHSRGVTEPMKPHRLTGFATEKVGDPYRLDKDGFPFHQNSADALEFLSTHKDQPFFLYYATWLVHTPIHTRSKGLLDKYVKKLGVKLPDDPHKFWMGEGQTNPFYCAMVEMLDHYVGQLFDYLETTEDPRWPGHKLVENTYIIFTSDNGGMEGHKTQIITDNYPLDRGKISLMEGGTRVPLIITGPGIAKGVESNVMVNGLDFYPTLLTLSGTNTPGRLDLDGCDLSKLLHEGPDNPNLVKDANGQTRDTMVWHFPNSAALESTIRVGDYKLVRNYDHINNPNNKPLELYRLYDSGKRADIEEQKDLATTLPAKAKEMDARLSEILDGMEASYPYYNPYGSRAPATKKNVCTVLSHEQDGDTVEFTYRENGAKVVRANLIHTFNGGDRYEEWFRTPAKLVPGNKAIATLPEGTTHYFLNLIDENNFLRCYPEILGPKNPNLAELKKFATKALVAAPAK
jgi:arylsulfatase A-like enzyme